MAANSNGLDPNHMAMKFPQYAYPYSTFLWMDPGAPEVQNQTYDVLIDLATRYDLDGLHFDDYFYPYPVTDVPFPDAATYAEYVANGGSLSVADWRRDNVNRLVERLNTGIHEVKPWLRFSISPFGIYRPCHEEGMPCSISGFDQYEGLYSDPKLWLREGWIDVLQPQLYWLIEPPQQSYPVLLDWWVSQNILDRHVFGGNYLSRIYEGWPLSEIRDQIQISREHNNRIRGSWGNIQFSAKVFGRNDDDSVQYFKDSVYPYASLTPEYPWLAQKAGVNSVPAEPVLTKIKQYDNAAVFEWDFANVMFEKNVAVYKLEQSSNSWRLVKTLPFISGRVELQSGVYAISNVDRFGKESSKVIVTV